MDLTDAEIKQLMTEGYSDEEIKGLLGKKSLWEQAKATLPTIADSALSFLPGAGATIGAAAAAPLSIGPWAPATLVGGAAIGGGTGKALENAIREWTGMGQPKTMGQLMTEPVTAGAEQGAWEAAFPVLGKVAGKMFAPFAGRMAASPEAQVVDKAVRERGLPISPESYNPSFAARTAERTSSVTPFGRMKAEKEAKELEQGLIKWGQEIKAANTATKADTKAAYDFLASEAGGRGAVLPMNKTYETIDGLLEDVTDKNLKAAIEKYFQAGRNPKFEDLDALQKNIWSNAYTKSGNMKKDNEIRGQILNAIKEDLSAIPGATSGTTLDELFKTAKGASKQERAFGIVKMMVDQSTRPSGGIGNYEFNPGKFLEIFQRYEPKLQKDFPDVYRNLKDFATVAQASMRDMKSAGGLGDTKTKSFVRNLFDTAIMGGSAVRAAQGDMATPAMVAVPMTFSYMTAKSMLNPKGWLRDFLTTGLKVPSGVSEGIKLGGRLAISPEPRAEGGPIRTGKPYLVGEQGPEVIVPEQDGQVLSNPIFSFLQNYLKFKGIKGLIDKISAPAFGEGSLGVADSLTPLTAQQLGEGSLGVADAFTPAASELSGAFPSLGLSGWMAALAPIGLTAYNLFGNTLGAGRNYPKEMQAETAQNLLDFIAQYNTGGQDSLQRLYQQMHNVSTGASNFNSGFSDKDIDQAIFQATGGNVDQLRNKLGYANLPDFTTGDNATLGNFMNGQRKTMEDYLNGQGLDAVALPSTWSEGQTGGSAGLNSPFDALNIIQNWDYWAGKKK
jgi:hypothetical protein